MALPNNTHTSGGSGTVFPTHLVGSNEYPVGMVADDDGHLKGSVPTYVAVYRLATEAAMSALSFTFVANTDKQWATIYHAAAATKTVKIRRVEFFIGATAAGVLNFELYRLTAATAPATGNPAITPISTNTSNGAAAEATCLALPTTAGSKTATQTFFSQEINLGANTAQTTNFTIPPICLWPAPGLTEEEMQPLELRAGVAEGVAVTLRNSAAVVIKGTVRIVFTEQ